MGLDGPMKQHAEMILETGGYRTIYNKFKEKMNRLFIIPYPDKFPTGVYISQYNLIRNKDVQDSFTLLDYYNLVCSIETTRYQSGGNIYYNKYLKYKYKYLSLKNKM